MRRRAVSSFVLPILLSGGLAACGGSGSTQEPGTGGSNASSGGSTGSGGKTGSGGTTASGGATGSGGQVGSGSGGATGSGGNSASSGGTTGSGGAKTGSGGASASGGAQGTGTGGGAPGGSGVAGHGAGSGGTAGGHAGSGGGAPGGAPGSGGSVGTAGSIGTSSTEDSGASCTVGTIPGNGTKIALLPDPFKKLDGTEMTMKSEWRCRREEILQTAEKIALGKKPPKPDMVTGSVTSSKITVNVMSGGKSSTFSATVKMPTGGSAPYPAVIEYDSGGFGPPLDSATLNSEGVAVISYNPYDVGAEGKGHGSNQSGAFYTVYSGGSGSTGLLAAWAWGASRIIDVIESQGSTILKPDAIAVSGCSRFGKGSFIAGVLDERIALTMPVESGTDGVPVWRGIAKGEKGENGNPPQSMSSAYSEQPWYYDGSMAIDSDPTVAPIDTHELVAMVAPRGLFIMENPHIGELASKYGHVAALGALEVYKALGVGDNLTYYSDVQSGTHCSARPEWVTPLKNNIERFLKKTGTAPGVVKASSSQTGDLSTWRDWTTPTLN